MSENRKAGYNWLFLIPFIATLIPSFYARSSPSLGGMPFFYWYLLLWIVLVGLLSALVYILQGGHES